MENKKRIALVAHDNKKKDLVEWVEYNWHRLASHSLVCTGTTGRLVEEAIQKKMVGSSDSMRASLAGVPIRIQKLKSGPLGGDQQLGSLISDNMIDIIIFFWDPMQPQPHDVDVKALLRIAVLYNVPTACNRATADFLISSELFEREYIKSVPNFEFYTKRTIV